MLQTRLVAIACAALAAACTMPQVRAEPGTLVIVGGGLDPGNSEIFSAFLEARPADSPLIAIIPAASGEPARSAEAFREALIVHGANADAIDVVRLALLDDPATADIDESRWAANADKAEEIARVAQAGAIWFTGGDQSRIAGLLLDADGHDTPMLAAIRARLRDGAVIGGTSAGAAVMSDPMITQGDTLAALLPDTQAEPLQVGHGLGFLKDMLVDQHFGERARLGRLAVALVRGVQPHSTGAGIDENTAIVLRPGSTTARVLGEGYVTFVDARMAEVGGGERFAVSNLVISLAASGDTLDLQTGAVTPAAFKNATVGNEYFATAPITGGGMALGATSLADVAGEALIDNSAAQLVERQSFSNGHGVTYRFIQTEASRGWWGRSPGGIARYSIEKVRFDIEPIELIIREPEN